MDPATHDMLAKACRDLCRRGLCDMTCARGGWCGAARELAGRDSVGRIGNRKLLAVMDELGIGKNELARRSGVSKQTVYRICAGDRLGNLDTWLRFAEALGKSLNDIVD